MNTNKNLCFNIVTLSLMFAIVSGVGAANSTEKNSFLMAIVFTAISFVIWFLIFSYVYPSNMTKEPGTGSTQP